VNRAARRDYRYKRGAFHPVQKITAAGVPWLLWGLLIRGGYLGHPQAVPAAEGPVPARREGFLGRALGKLKGLFK